MPTSSSAKKRVRQNAKSRLRNRAHRTRWRRQLSKARLALAGEDAAAAEAEVTQATRVLDQSATKGVVHRRKAARLKSRLAKRLNAQRGAAGDKG